LNRVQITKFFSFQLISPEDLLNAAVHMEELGLPVRFVKQTIFSFNLDGFFYRLRVLSSGIKSFELTNRNEKKDLQEIAALVSA
jgi:hypothetical protein